MSSLKSKVQAHFCSPRRGFWVSQDYQLILYILILSWIKPNQELNISPWAWHYWTPSLVNIYTFCCLGLEPLMKICWAELSTGAWTQIWAYLTIPQLSPTTVETMARSREVPREAMKAKADEPDQLNIMYHVIIMIVEIKTSDNQRHVSLLQFSLESQNCQEILW